MKCWLEACETQKAQHVLVFLLKVGFPHSNSNLLLTIWENLVHHHRISNVSRVLFIIYGSYIVLIFLFLFIQTFQKSK